MDVGDEHHSHENYSMKWRSFDAGTLPEFQLAADSLLGFIKRLVLVTVLSHGVLIKSKQPHPRGDGRGVILCIMHLRWLMRWTREIESAGSRPRMEY